MHVVPYASTVGSFKYAMLCTKLDVCFIAGKVSRYIGQLSSIYSSILGEQKIIFLCSRVMT